MESVYFLLMCCLLMVGEYKASEKETIKESDKERKYEISMPSQSAESERKHRNSAWTWNWSGVSSVQGLREDMEDEYTREQFTWGNFYGVYDGHSAGRAKRNKAATFVRKYLHKAFDMHFNKKISRIGDGSNIHSVIRAALHESFVDTDARLEQLRDIYFRDDEFGYLGSKYYGSNAPDDSGTTVLVALLYKNLLFVANAGDSRAVLCVKGMALPQSTDYNYSNEMEVKRVKSLVREGFSFNPPWNFYLENEYSGQQISVYRAIGHQNKDHFPGIVLVEPDTTDTVITEDTEFLIIASDGVWARITNEAAIWCVREFMRQYPHDVEGAAEFLQKTAIGALSNDNVTAIVVDVAAYFQNYQQQLKKDTSGLTIAPVTSVPGKSEIACS
jgi:serine/threonine protein phosphatase PrpC